MFSELLKDYLDARDRLTAERHKTPPSARALEDLAAELERCASALDEYVAPEYRDGYGKVVRT